MSGTEPAWKDETGKKFSRMLAPGEDLVAVTGGLMFGRENHYFYIGLTQGRLLLLDVEGWLGKALGAVGIRLPRRGYGIHRSMIVSAELNKTGSGTELVLRFSPSGERLAFEQVALGAEELAAALGTSDEQDAVASAAELIESARTLQVFGLTGSARRALSKAREADLAAASAVERTLADDRWQEEREAYRTAGIFMGIIIGIGALAALVSISTVGWSLELCGEYILAVLGAVLLLRPLFQDPPAGRREVFARIGTTMLLFVVLLVVSRDYEILAGAAGVYGAVVILLTGRPNRSRRWIAIGVFVVSLVVTLVALATTWR
jgi:hypothetical protein